MLLLLKALNRFARTSASYGRNLLVVRSFERSTCLLPLVIGAKQPRASGHVHSVTVHPLLIRRKTVGSKALATRDPSHGSRSRVACYLLWYVTVVLRTVTNKPSTQEGRTYCFARTYPLLRDRDRAKGHGHGHGHVRVQ